MAQSNILKEILQFKQKEVEAREKEKPLEELKVLCEGKQIRDFKGEISTKTRSLNLIAEVKKASPSKGIVRESFDLEKIVEVYSRHAQAISVLTDEKFFQGKLDYLKQVKDFTNLPVLRKDFIISEYQVFESKAFGADAILLIAAAMDKGKLKRLYKLAKSLELHSLVEVHSSADLEKALTLNPEIIGINNRNLETLKTDIGATLKLRELIPEGKVIVSESGFSNAGDLEKVKGKVDSVLIGTALMKEKDIEAKMLEMGF